MPKRWNQMFINNNRIAGCSSCGNSPPTYFPKVVSVNTMKSNMKTRFSLQIQRKKNNTGHIQNQAPEPRPPAPTPASEPAPAPAKHTDSTRNAIHVYGAEWCGFTRKQNKEIEDALGNDPDKKNKHIYIDCAKDKTNETWQVTHFRLLFMKLEKLFCKSTNFISSTGI